MKELPEGWVKTELVNVVNYQKGKKPKILKDTYSPDLVPYLDIEAFVNHKIRKYAAPNSSKLAKESDILIVWDGARSGLTGQAKKGAIGSTIVSLTPIKINQKYLLRFVQSKYYYINNNPRGSGIPHVDPDLFWNIQIPLPPLKEQARIVAKLEKIIAKINTCQQRLERIPTILKRFRQSVLAAACSGRLTADWREKNPNIEPAEELLKRIHKERKRLYEEDCAKAKGEGRKKPKSPFYKQDSIHNKIIDNLPLSWTLTYLGNIADTQGGIQKTPKRKPVNNPYPYLRVANVYRGYLNLDRIECFELFDKKELNKWKLKKGDLLIVEGNGSPTEIGRCAIWNEEIDNCVHQNHIIRSRLLLNIESKFILSYLNSYQGMETMMQLSSSTSGLHTLSVSKINNITIPLAPLEEQKEIVSRVEALFKKCDSIEKRYQKAKNYTNKLTQSILAKAFRGELVPQDPNDEPAEILLEKIRSEKAQQEKKTKAKKKTKRKTTSTKKQSKTKPRQLEIPDLN